MVTHINSRSGAITGPLRDKNVQGYILTNFYLSFFRCFVSRSRSRNTKITKKGEAATKIYSSILFF
jgi:hypothetical protein